MVAHASNNLRTNDVSDSCPLFLQNLPSQLSIYSGFSEDDVKQRLFGIFFIYYVYMFLIMFKPYLMLMLMLMVISSLFFSYILAGLYMGALIDLLTYTWTMILNKSSL